MPIPATLSELYRFSVWLDLEDMALQDEPDAPTQLHDIFWIPKEVTPERR
jgi:hypothetical protein